MIETTKVVDGNLQITQTKKIIRTRLELVQEVDQIINQMKSLKKQFADLKEKQTKLKKDIKKLPEPVVEEL